MLSVLVIFALFLAAVVFFAAVRHAVCLRLLLGGSAVVSAFGGYALLVAPGDYLMSCQQVFPRVFHPWAVGGWSLLAFVFFVSLSSGLLARCLVNGCRWWREGR